MLKNWKDNREILQGNFIATQGPELYVRREGDRIIADCTEREKVLFLTGSAWAPYRLVQDSGITHAEYPIYESDRWVRVEVIDMEGRQAWSPFLMLKDL